MVVEHVTRAETSRPKRRKWPWSFVIAGIAIAAAVVYLISANTSASAEYYMTIGELRSCTSCVTRTVRVAGVVAPGSVVRDDKTQVIHFSMTDQSKALAVVYSGVVPDIFRPGIQVVVEGRPGSDGLFHAQNLLAKCPSKFQSATPSASGS